MVRSLLLIALLATPAYAEPMFAVGLDYTVGHGGHVEALDLGLRLEPGLFVRVNRWHATLSFPVNPKIESANPERDTDHLVGVGVAGRLAYRMPLFGGVLSIGGAMTRRWLYAERDVLRTCEQSGECVAGSYLDRPYYHAWAPQLRIGIGPDKAWDRAVMGASFEVIVEAIGLNDVPPDGIRNITVTGALTFTVGGGPARKRKAPPALVGQNL